MDKLINKIGELTTVNFINGQEGSFRHIAKCRAGYPTCSEVRFDSENEMYCKEPGRLLNTYKRGSLQTVEFRSKGSNTWLTVFARVGKKVKIMDESIMRGLTVGTINGLFDNTNLMNQDQYKAVNSKTWADNAFVMNEK